MRFRRLAEWLAWQERLNPRGIDLGLERLGPVARRMGLGAPAPLVVTVAGTNGKGSCVAVLEALLAAAGLRAGAYTSPFLRRYNETVRVGGVEVCDAALVEAFARVDEARGEVPLTWFEFRTLAVADLFERAALDVAVLEVGLGGRLDAVNLFDADVAVVTSIGVDHVDWLGPDRAAIAREKAGVFRAGRPAVCAEPDPPDTLLAAAREVGAALVRIGVDFHCHVADGGWTFEAADRRVDGLPLPAFPGEWQRRNAAAAMMALVQVDALPGADAVRAALGAVRVPGRAEIRPGRPERVLDVAHNVQAAEALRAVLAAGPAPRRTVAVFAMLRDKDVEGVAAVMDRAIDTWHVGGLEHHPRGASGIETAARVARALPAARVRPHADVLEAWRAASEETTPRDRLVVFGSFEAVRPVLDLAL